MRIASLLVGGLSLVFLFIFLSESGTLRPSLQRGLLIAAVGLGCLAFLVGIFQTYLARSLKALIEDAQIQAHLLLQALQIGFTSLPERVILLGLTLVGILLRGLFVSQSIRTDEAVTYLHYASRSLPLALSNYSAPNNHLLHTLFAWVSVHVLGNSEIALRLPALLMGVLLIVVTYGLGCVLANRRVGLLAAGLVAVSSVLIEYSVNARGYTLQCVLFGLSIIVASKTRHSLSPTRWGLLALVLALGFYTVPTMLYPFGGLMLWLLAEVLIDREAETRPSYRKLIQAWFLCGLLTVGLTLLLYAPVLLVSGISAVIGNQYVQPFTFDVFLQQLPIAAQKLWSHWHTSIPWPIAILFGLAVLLGLVRGQKHRVPLLLPCVIWSLITLCLQRVVPFERSWLPFLPLYFATAAAGLVWLWERWVGRKAWIGYMAGGLLIAILGGSILITRSPYLSTETGTFRDAKAIVQDLQALLQPGDRVIWEHPSGDSLTYYAVQQGMDWEAYTAAQSSGDLYVVLNTEYPQTLESVARWNGINLDRYTAEPIVTYPLGVLLRLGRKTD